MKKILLSFLTCLLTAFCSHAETKTYTYDFSKNTYWVTEAGGTTNVSTGSSNKLNAFYYAETGDEFNAGGNGYFSSGYFLWGKSGAYIQLPAFDGETITNVTATSSTGHSQNVSVGIYSGDTEVVAAVKWSTRSTEYSYDIPADYQSSVLRLQVTNGYNSQLVKIVITTEAGSDDLTDPELAWDDSNAAVGIMAYLNEENEYPSLIKPGDLENAIKYSSSNEDAATINAETGEITLLAGGSTTITASYEGDTKYSAASVSYTLYVLALDEITLNGQSDSNVTLYLGDTATFAGLYIEGDKSTFSYTVNGGEEISGQYTWTPTEIGSYTIEATATWTPREIMHTKTVTFTVNVEPILERCSVEFVFADLGYANSEEVTDEGNDEIALIFDKNTSSTTPKYYTSGSAIRMYSGNRLTISANDGCYVAKVEFVYDDASANNGTLTPDSGLMSSDYTTWNYTSKVQSVQFDLSNNNRRIQQITVTYVVVSLTQKTAVSLAFDTNYKETVIGEDFSAPTLTVDPEAAKEFICYSSSDEDVATIDAESGEIKILAFGKTTITASISDNEIYDDASAEYVLFVKNPNVVYETLSVDKFGVSSTTYAEATYSDLDCGIVYAANLAGGNSSIQLRAKSDSGVVTSANTYGLVANQAKIKWHSATSATRTLVLYGKTDVYASAADLYDDANQGSQIASVCIDDGNPQTVIFEGEYPYIGFRSKSNTQYIQSIVIEWAVPAPTVMIGESAAGSIVEYTGSTAVTFKCNENAKVYYLFTQDAVAVADAEEPSYAEVPAEGLTVTTSGILSFYSEISALNLKSDVGSIQFKNATAITEVENVCNEPAQWFDLNGRRVAAPAKGIYILRQGGKTSKHAF